MLFVDILREIALSRESLNPVSYWITADCQVLGKTGYDRIWQKPSDVPTSKE